jgi:exodeoxyribonuclease VII large subunit
MQRLIDERWPGLRRTVISVLVQGERAADEIVRAISTANRMSDPFWAKANGVPPIDLIICGRGGGSPEDLWAFNLELVARAFIDSATPIVSAVGHETDVLVTDMVADLRAATPSHAIERCVPYRSDLVQRCDELRLTMSSAMYRRYERLRDNIAHLRARLGQAPISGLMRTRTRIDNLGTRLTTAANNRCQQERSVLSTVAATLNAIHPDKVSKRGWTLVRDSAGRLITSAATSKKGSTISIRFHDGAISAEVKQKELDEHE